MALGGSYGDLHRLRIEVNRLFDLLVDRPLPPSGTWQPPADIVEHDDLFEVLIEVPGIVADNLQIEICDKTLVVRGRKERLASEPAPDRFCLMERYTGSFVMEFDVPEAINPTQGKAELQQGVLSIILPKLKDKRHRTYTVPITEEK